MKLIPTFLMLIMGGSLSAQFNVHITTTNDFNGKEAILYTLLGSKDIVQSKAAKINNQWIFRVSNPYSGMMKVYFPDTNTTINMISENKNVSLSFSTQNNKVSSVVYQDEANKLMENIQEIEQKKEIILPALYQIQEYYKPKNSFYQAINSEISRLDAKPMINQELFPFISFYNTNYNKYLVKTTTSKTVTQSDLVHFIANSNEFLESSSLLRPILVSFLNSGVKTNTEKEVDNLLTKLNVETPRGQVVLSELIDIFDAYAMTSLKSKFLTEAKNLKCTINDRLKSTINKNENTELGAVFQDYTFQNAIHTPEKSLYGVKSKFKIIVFWSSTCSHCETELPKLMNNYAELKNKGVEVIGFSLDTDLATYTSKSSVFPWVSCSELKGWNSSVVDTYNIHATPTYLILNEQNKIIDKPDHVQDVEMYFKLKKDL